MYRGKTAIRFRYLFLTFSGRLRVFVTVIGGRSLDLAHKVLEFFGSLDFRGLVHSRDFTGQAFQRGLINLAFAVRLVLIVIAAFEIAQDFGNGYRIAGI